MNHLLDALDTPQRIALIVAILSLLGIVVDWLLTRSAYGIVILAFFVSLAYLLVTALL